MTSYQHHLSMCLLVFAATAAVAACGSGDKPGAAGAPASGRAQAPYGTYTRDVTKRDIARTAKLRGPYGPNQEAPGAGPYRLVIAKGAAQDVLKVTGPDGTTVGMDIVIDHGDLLLTNYVSDEAAFCGFEYPVVARYAFNARGATLTLKPRHPDRCPDRDSLLTGDWRRP
jgi:hypothetical protein